MNAFQILDAGDIADRALVQNRNSDLAVSPQAIQVFLNGKAYLEYSLTRHYGIILPVRFRTDKNRDRKPDSDRDSEALY